MCLQDLIDQLNPWLWAGPFLITGTAFGQKYLGIASAWRGRYAVVGKQPVKPNLDDHEADEKITRDAIRSSDDRPDANKDDYYFQSRFAGLFRGIQHWIYVHYLDADIDRELIDSLSENLMRNLFERAGASWEKTLQSDHLSVLQAAVIALVVREILDVSVLGIEQERLGLLKQIIEASMISDAEAEVKWRTSTFERLSKMSSFWELFKPRARTLATLIVDDLTPFAPNAKKVPRTNKLAALIEDAGLIATEIQKEPSRFRFIEYPPGTECDEEVSAKVTDVMSLVRDEDIEGRTVMLTVSPAVVRVAFEATQDVLVLKAKVVLN